jgi:hypothetical protein
MLGWLKDKVGSGFEAVQRASLVYDLTTHFEPLGTIKNPLPDAASRLAHFVVDGDDARILQDLKTSQASRFVAYTVRDGSATEQARSLNGLLKTLARDVDRLVRLAFAFEAAYGAHGFYGSPDIPGFGGRCDWIVIFLKLVATAAANGETNLPAESVEAMVTANGEHASVLVSGALLVQDAQGKYKTSYWLPTPYTCFRSLEGFSGLVSRFPEIVRQSLQQTDSRARAYALTALHTLQVYGLSSQNARRSWRKHWVCGPGIKPAGRAITLKRTFA